MRLSRRLRAAIPFLCSALVVGGFGLAGSDRPAGAPLPAQGTRLACSLLQVSDGDTVTVDCGEGQLRVRLWGLDTPEMGQQPWGARARVALQALLPATLGVRVRDHDRYGRVVAQLYRGEEDLGLQLLTAGWGAVYRRYNDDPQYLAAEAEARRQRRGIWAEPGFQQRPWEWRRYNPPGSSS